MTPGFREGKNSDIIFLREMLYEAVFWRALEKEEAPSPEEGLAFPEVGKALDNWGERKGDAAIIALVGEVSVGAAWYRYWTDDNNIRGHLNASIPTLVIAVHQDYRRQGIGKKLIEKLIQHAGENGIKKISLMASKDNFAYELYKKCGFREYRDEEHSWLMVYEGGR